MKLWTLIAVVSLGVASAKTSIPVSSDYTFSTQKSQHKKTLRRQRRAEVDTKDVAAPENPEAVVKEEDHAFWYRFLDGHMMSIPTPKPTNPPVTPETPSPTPCPVLIDVDCVSVDGSQACTDIGPIPDEGSGADCIVEVEYSYTLTNNGDEVERIYSLEITRGGVTEDITSTFPVTDMQPGQSAIIIQNAEINICEGPGAFNTEAAFITGPPCDVEVVIACESENGDECRQLPQAQDPSECLIDITYTYTVTNIGNVDANIVLFTRTRNGEFVDLMPSLSDTFLPVAQNTAVQETEEIDRCVQQSFATNTVVAQLPNADLLCEDVGYYP